MMSVDPWSTDPEMGMRILKRGHTVMSGYTAILLPGKSFSRDVPLLRGAILAPLPDALPMAAS